MLPFLILEKKKLLILMYRTCLGNGSIPKRCSILIISSFVGMEKRNQSFHPPSRGEANLTSKIY